MLLVSTHQSVNLSSGLLVTEVPMVIKSSAGITHLKAYGSHQVGNLGGEICGCRTVRAGRTPPNPKGLRVQQHLCSSWLIPLETLSLEYQLFDLDLKWKFWLQFKATSTIKKYMAQIKLFCRLPWPCSYHFAIFALRGREESKRKCFTDYQKVTAEDKSDFWGLWWTLWGQNIEVLYKLYVAQPKSQRATKKSEGQDSSQILLNFTDEKRPKILSGGRLESKIWAPESMFITS